MPGDGRGPRDGAALALVVLALVALTLLAHGALLLARQELRASVTAARVLQARAGAEAAVGEAWGRPDVRGDSARPWSRTPSVSGATERMSWALTVVSLGRETLLLEGRGAARGEPWSLRSARLGWVMDPLTRTGAFRAVVEVGPGAPVQLGGTVDGDLREPDASASGEPGCAAWRRVLDSIFPAGLPAVAEAPGHARGEPSLGWLASPDLLALLPHLPSASGTPVPSTSAGRCLADDPWNWGDPGDPAAPCANHFAVRASPGSLLVEGGSGQGLLVVDGPLTLRAARFDGVVLSGGALTLSGGATVRGLVRAYGGLALESGTSVVGDGCRALAALEGARDALAVTLPLPGGWLGPW